MAKTDKIGPQRIISLQVDNYMRIKTFFIKPEGRLIVIGGKNKSGKSSALGALVAAIEGKKAQSDQPIRRGQSKAEVLVETTDFTIELVIRHKSQSLVVKAKSDGESKGSPQTLLQSMRTEFTFDPLAFAAMGRKEQVDTLMRIVGLDFTKQDTERAKLFAKRTEVGRDGKRAKAQLEGMTHHEDAPDEEISVKALMAELASVQAANKIGDDLSRGINAMASTITAERHEVDILAGKLDKAKRRIEQAEFQLKDDREELDNNPRQSTGELQARISEADGINAKVRANTARKAIVETQATEKKKYDSLEGKIKAIDKGKAKEIANAEFPVEGMGFSDDGVTLNDLPFDQASTAEQVIVGVSLGAAANPTLRLMRIQRGSEMDADTMALIEEICVEKNMWAWVERASEGEECQVIIEDGEIKGEDKPCPCGGSGCLLCK